MKRLAFSIALTQQAVVGNNAMPKQNTNHTHNATTNTRPGLFASLLPVVFLVFSLWVAVVHYRTLQLSAHIPLIAATLVAALTAWRMGTSFHEIEQGMIKGISLALPAILILLVIGILVATWIQAGIVPSMIVYGLQLLSPGIFLAAATLICSLISLATGSSWSTAATIGIALMGVGEGLGIQKEMVAGAIISGAYFGDKMSPLSDTTNLAPAMAGADLFDHIRHMVYTTGPSLILALILFAFLGMGHAGQANLDQVQSIHEAVVSQFRIHPLLLLPPVLVIVTVVLRIPALPALLAGCVLGGLLAWAVQDQSLGQVLKVSFDGVAITTPNALVNDLLSRGGLKSMFSTVGLILCALAFGGVMERAGMLGSIANAILHLARGVGGLVSATLVTCLGMNLLAADQYLAIVVPGRMYRQTYQDMNLAPKNLSRALEDSGTLTSVLIPWNTCGAFMIATLGLAPWTYVPYCFLNLINPLISLFYGFTGWTMSKIKQPPSGPEPTEK